MAATNFTPIQLYRTTTAAAVPVNTNLADGELARNAKACFSSNGTGGRPGFKYPCGPGFPSFR